MLITADRRILLANDPASELFGWEETGLTGQLLDVLLPESMVTAHHDWSDEFFHKPSARVMGENPRLEGVRRNGERVQLDISLTPVKVQDEYLVLVIVRNIGALTSRLSIPLNALSALSEIARLAGGPMEAAEVYRRIARQIRTLLPYDQLVVCALDHHRPVLRNLYVSGQEGAERQSGGAATPGEKHLAELRSMTRPVAFTGQAVPVWLAETCESTGHTSDRLISHLAAPLRWDGEVIGSLNLRSRSGSAYTEESLKLAEQIAASVASVVAKSRSNIVEAEAADQRIIMASVGTLVGNATDIRSVVDSLAA